jgi:hypothetical protein
VRVLAIDQRFAIEHFAGLEQFAITGLADCQRIKTQHPAESQAVAPTVGFRDSHPPVRQDEFAVALRAALIVEQPIDDAVLHHSPAAGRGWRSMNVRRLLRPGRRRNSNDDGNARHPVTKQRHAGTPLTST